jgi:hypothetical protein
MTVEIPGTNIHLKLGEIYFNAVPSSQAPLHQHGRPRPPAGPHAHPQSGPQTLPHPQAARLPNTRICQIESTQQRLARCRICKRHQVHHATPTPAGAYAGLYAALQKPVSPPHESRRQQALDDAPRCAGLPTKRFAHLPRVPFAPPLILHNHITTTLSAPNLSKKYIMSKATEPTNRGNLPHRKSKSPPQRDRRAVCQCPLHTYPYPYCTQNLHNALCKYTTQPAGSDDCKARKKMAPKRYFKL